MATISDLNKNERCTVDLKNFGKVYPPYLPTHIFDGPFINTNHQRYFQLPTRGSAIIADIRGALRPQDALKIYELAHFAEGLIIELGTNRGLSASISAQASVDSGRNNQIITVDLDEKFTEIARDNVRGKPGFENITFVTEDGTQALLNLIREGRTCDFIFVDHAHDYQPMKDTCDLLKDVVAPGGFVLFHDYNDGRNLDPNNDEYGVYQGVKDGLARDQFEKYGIYGCTGLFRKVAR